MYRDETFPKLEKTFEMRLPGDGFVVIRVDGHNFTRFTRQFERPFSPSFAGAMDTVARQLVNTFTGSLFAYVQSDEVSLIITDRLGARAEPAFGGRASKLISLAASTATAAFMTNLPAAKGVPLFDGRAFALNDMTQVGGYLHYRRLDARKNAISMAARSNYSHAALQGLGTRDLMDMLERDNYGLLPEDFFNGRLVHPVHMADDSLPGHPVRRRWLTEPATLVLAEQVLSAAAAKLVTRADDASM